MSPPTLYLDTSSLAYRAFYALPDSLRAADGRPVNAARGVIEMITRLVVDRSPRAVVAVFDADYRPAVRVAAYPDYKAGRDEDPPDLAPQFDMLVDLFDAFGIARAEAPDLEADDAIATLVHAATAQRPAAIVTGDRDMFALVRDPAVSVLFTVKGVRELETYDEAKVLERYGVSSSQYTEFAMLRGDPSDGLPGVAGIGPVRAAKLLSAHGSIEGIIAARSKLPKAQAAAFASAGPYLDAMKKVVPMIANATLKCTDAHAPDAARLAKLADTLALGGPIDRLRAALDALPKTAH